MSNTYFEFKQFKLFHDKCAMKVGTDGVLLGAWAKPGNSKTILDIGTGTGLLALMLAQKAGDAQIDAIEIDAEAVNQARFNFITSDWKNKLKCYHTSLQEYSRVCKKKYDYILSNPPYFSHGPVAEQKERAIARHNLELPLPELISCSKSLLAMQGKIALVLPRSLRRTLVSAIAKHNLWIEQEVHIKPNPSKAVNRVLFLLSGSFDSRYKREELIIENARHQYTEEFKALTRDFYLEGKNEFRLE